MIKKLEEGQIVLCTVTKIRGTIVFVNIEDYDEEGTIIFSEISPGRIRNIRDYAFPEKKIVCKVLKINPQGVHLSLRRVKLKEKKELNEVLKREKSLKALLKTILKEKSELIINKIKEKYDSISDFLEKAKQDPKLLEKYMPKTDAEKIIKILKEKKVKEIILSKRFSLSSKDPKGMLIVKEIIKQAIKPCASCEILYIAAGKYLIRMKTKDPKQADQQLDKIIECLEDLAKQKDCDFSEIK